MNQYHLELEIQGGAKLMQDFTVIEVHQVKAYLNSSTTGAYTSALAGFEFCAGENCLHTICEITNWADLTMAQNHVEDIDIHLFSGYLFYLLIHEKTADKQEGQIIYIITY